MIGDQIRKLLRQRPYWGPRTIARVLGRSYGVVRTTAAREEIRFMDRYEVEAYVDGLVEAIEKLEVPEDGEKERVPETPAG